MDSVHWTAALPLDVQGGRAPHQQPLSEWRSQSVHPIVTMQMSLLLAQQSSAVLLTALLQLSQAIACALALVTITTRITRIKLLLPDYSELTYEYTAG